MQGASDPVVVQVPAGRDHLGLEREVPGPLDLTEIRRAAGAHQCLQALLAMGAHDLDLQVSAACGTPPMVGRATGRACAGVSPVEHRELPGTGWGGGGEHAHSRPTPIDHPEPVATEPPGLSPSQLGGECRIGESIEGATRTAGLGPKVSARDVKGRLGVQISAVRPDLAEGDLLGMSQEPRRLVVERGGPFLERTDPEGDPERAALAAQAITGRGPDRQGCGEGVSGGHDAIIGRCLFRLR
jgi:hypothetical protein